jgi:SMI1 / KNR4 family (SUKH-1)
MTDDDLVAAIRSRIANPKLRIDFTTVGIPPIYGIASDTDLDSCEAEIGMPLPTMLRRLYLEVENGGFGPGAGILGVTGGHTDVDGRTLSALYTALQSQGWPRAILPISDLGDGAWSCIDGHGGTGERVLTMNGAQLTQTKFDLSSWLGAWVTGTDMNCETFEFEDGSMLDPFTKRLVGVKRRREAKGVFIGSFQIET